MTVENTKDETTGPEALAGCFGAVCAASLVGLVVVIGYGVAIGVIWIVIDLTFRVFGVGE